MPAPVKFEAKVINVQVKSKTVKEKTEDGLVYESTEKIGRITLEFDGETTDVASLARFIEGRYVHLGIASTQTTLPILKGTGES